MKRFDTMRFTDCVYSPKHDHFGSSTSWTAPLEDWFGLKFIYVLLIGLFVPGSNNNSYKFPLEAHLRKNATIGAYD